MRSGLRLLTTSSISYRLFLVAVTVASALSALSEKNTIYGLDIVSVVKEGVEQTFSWDSLDMEDGI